MERTGINKTNWQANSSAANKDLARFHQIQLPAEDHWNGIPINLKDLAGTTEYSFLNIIYLDLLRRKNYCD